MEMNENLGYEESYKQPDLEGKIETNRIKALKNLAIGTGIAAVVGLGSLLWINRDKLNLDTLEKMTLHKIGINEDEAEYAYELSSNSKYEYTKGKNKGKPNYELLTDAINKKYWNGENVRTAFSVKKILKQTYKDLENRTNN